MTDINPETEQDNSRLADALDVNRYHEIAKNADLGVNFWASLELAARRGDVKAVRYHAQQVVVLTKATLALVKVLGSADGSDG